MVTPNGLIAHLYGPVEGRRHDAFMLNTSGLLPLLQQIVKPNGEPFVLYGNPAYGLTQSILAPFKGAQISANEAAFNKEMSKVRLAVEWGFGKITQYFAYLGFKKKKKSYYNQLENIMQLLVF